MLNRIYAHRFQDSRKRQVTWEVLVKCFFQKFVKQSDTVLELGSGYGEFINHISCRQKIGLDLNPDSKKHLAPGIRFIHGSSTKINLASSSVDKIFVSNFFEHLTQADIEKTVTESFRLLKQGGQVLVLQPNIRFCLKDFWRFFDHITPIDDRGLDEIFISTKLTPVLKILRFLPYTMSSNLPAHPLLIKLYLSCPFVWPVFGQQSFLVYQK